MEIPRISRRRLLTTGVVATVVPAASAAMLSGAMPWQENAADAPPEAFKLIRGAQGFFTPAESAFVIAAVARLIPQDELGPGALEAGVPDFIDSQLAGDYGQATRWYMQGPWAPGEPTQGYQTRMTPAALYRTAIREIDDSVAKAHNGVLFAKLAATDQDSWLARLEKGDVQLPTADAKTFFTMLLQNTKEGFWSDPIYGGNRDMVGWKLIGFPGARYNHRDFVLRHGERYPLPPVGISGRPDWKKG